MGFELDARAGGPGIEEPRWRARHPGSSCGMGPALLAARSTRRVNPAAAPAGAAATRKASRAACEVRGGRRCWGAVYTLVELLLELKALASAPDPHKQLEKINALLGDPALPAELQVGRHYVAKLLAGAVEQQVHDLDPRARKAAIETVRAVFPRSAAGRVLRRVVKDPDAKVRGAARRAARRRRARACAPPGGPRCGPWRRDP